MWWLYLLACSGPDSDTEITTPDTVPWSRSLPALANVLTPSRGLQPTRAIVHLHSPWSHDACDGDPLPNGQVNEPCLQDLRAGLCATHIDMAFVTDHPTHAGDQAYNDLFHHRDGDRWVDVDGNHRANVIVCDDGHEITWVPGIEDELMPVGLDRQVGDAAENQRIYNGYDAEAVDAETEAGARVFTAHTEQRAAADMERLQDAGLVGTEVFNLHAAFDPDIRAGFLGLPGTSWFGDIAPFTSPTGTAEPDLFVLAVLQEQTVSVAMWDHLLTRGPMVATAGTDAHQNVLPLLLRDGERGDSYRRMLSWFSNTLLVDGQGELADEAALAAGRSYIAFEVLGTPVDFDFHLIDDAGVVEMGGTGGAGTLSVGCPAVSALSPHGTEAPEVVVTVYKDGVAWKTGCGEFATEGAGVYRAAVTMVPFHLRPFLGDDPEPWLHAYPWIYGNAIRVN